jgi:hypothetical protein
MGEAVGCNSLKSPRFCVPGSRVSVCMPLHPLLEESMEQVDFSEVDEAKNSWDWVRC